MPRKRSSKNGLPNAASTRRVTRGSAKKEDSIPEVFKDMLIDAYASNPADFEPDTRPAKRRKVGAVKAEEQAVLGDAEFQAEDRADLNARGSSKIADSGIANINQPTAAQQIVLDDFDASDEDSDVDFEDVPLLRNAEAGDEDDEGISTEEQVLRIDLSAPIDGTTIRARRRKPVGKAERELRIDVHKWHLLSLLMHVAARNSWCDDERVQRTLRPLVPKKVIKWLHVDENESQAQRKVSFDKGIEEISQLWRLQWKTTVRGMRRAYWRENLDIADEMEQADDPVDLEDFRVHAKECSGSRDVGAQLFCALLRSVAVDTRVVCSLQTLPITRVAKGETPQKPKPIYIHAGAQDFGSSSSAPRPKKMRFSNSPYPIFWVEVFSPSIQQWLPLDPLVRHTINKPRTGFEPPSSDSLNSMTYVVGFEEDGSAKDLTLRYASTFNAKTRKLRIESTKGGKSWYDKTMKFFARAIPETRDQIEIAELERRAASEGMPKNVQDFKDHPIYVLERHLRANEVLEPKREVGKFGGTSGKNIKVESVYRREDVHLCRSADAWYRRGRDIADAEQPLKRVMPKTRNDRDIDRDDDDEDGAVGVALYAEYQTKLYVPPPVVDGRVPRNAFGNLDVYVPNMIPPGGVHIKHSLAASAARTLKIDFAEAVTGFKFKGRQGTAVIDGVVVDARETAAMLAVIDGLQEQLAEEVAEHRRSVLLAVWQKMHAALAVRKRIEDDYIAIGGEADNDDEEEDPDYQSDDMSVGSGGFMPDAPTSAEAARDQTIVRMSKLKDKFSIVLPDEVTYTAAAVTRSPHKLQESNDREQGERPEQDDLFGSEPEEEGGFVRDEEAPAAGNGLALREHSAVDDRTIEAGGFVKEGDEPATEAAEQGGGFLLDDDEIPMDTVEDVHDGGFLVEVEVQQQELNKAADQPGPVIVTDEKVKAPGQTHTDQGHPQPERHPFSPDTEHAKGSANSDNLSETSLLSHDPDEEDAEAQWVEDAFEDDV